MIETSIEGAERGVAAEHAMRPGDLCVVTGASGYLASWLARDLLERGLRVRGTIRGAGDEAKVKTLRSLLPGLELAEADLRAPAGWAGAVAGCRWVFHVASPQAVPTERDRTGGAVQGTEHVLRAALAEPSVEKVVLTSSEAAIAYGHPATKQRFTEDDWTVLDGPAGRNDYMRSKTLAERRAWELVADPAVNTRGVPLSVIHPGFIAGPSLVPWGRYSLDTLKNVAEGRMPLFPDLDLHMVDVRDCARMHSALMNDPATNGHRHFSFGVTGKMVDLAREVRRQYATLGFTPRAAVMPAPLAFLASLVSSDLRAVYGKLGHPNRYETRWPTVHRYVHTSFAQIVKDSMDSMLEHGWLTPRVAGRRAIAAGRPSTRSPGCHA